MTASQINSPTRHSDLSFPNMTSLPTDPFTLKGGCFCTAITYTISVPALASRPAMPDRPVKYLLGPQSATSKRLPIITLDHCTSCRRISGSVLETWFVCPQSWVSFSLANRAFSERVEISHAGEVVRPKEAMLEKTHLRYFSSSENTHRTFCGKCGTHLTFHYSGSGE